QTPFGSPVLMPAKKQCSVYIAIIALRNQQTLGGECPEMSHIHNWTA
ncbi:hypothetical protein CDAR_522791, partial [Caerostris darwini]